MSENKKEMVNHPDHYQGNKLEVIDIIEDYNLGFNLGNAIKYILRCEKKHHKTEDLKKAIWYIEREIKNNEIKPDILKACASCGCAFATKDEFEILCERCKEKEKDANENKNCCIKKCFSCGKEFRSDNARDLICPKCYTAYVGD